MLGGADGWVVRWLSGGVVVQGWAVRTVGRVVRWLRGVMGGAVRRVATRGNVVVGRSEPEVWLSWWSE